MRLELSQRLADYEVTRPPLGRCTRAGSAVLAAWWGTEAVDAPSATPIDDGLVVDLVGDAPAPATRMVRSSNTSAALSI